MINKFNKKFTTPTDFQDFADLWVKNSLHTGSRLAKLYWSRTKKLATSLKNKEWKKTYYANKAIYFDASIHLPFETLALIGEILSEQKYHSLMKHIIKENVFLYKGQVYKLDDTVEQNKIRRALRTKSFARVIDFTQNVA